MIRVAALVALLTVYSSASEVYSSAGQRDARFFNNRQFWEGVSRAGVDFQERLDSNLETTLDQLSTIGKSVGQISRTIEDQVQDSLPFWMRTDHSSRSSVSPQDAPIEAMEGSLGMDGLDDGLQVYFEGDSDKEEFPEPHIIPVNAESFPEGDIEEDAEEAVPPPRTGGPLFDLRFDFNNGFPGLSNYPPSYPFGTFFRRMAKPWWRGENVCVEEKEIDEGAATDAEDSSVSPVSIFTQLSMKSCSETNDKYTCTIKSSNRGVFRTIFQTHKCCHGYVKEIEGCTRVNMVPLDESLEGLELTDFLTLAKNAGVVDILRTNNLTVFAPSNEAVEDFVSDLTETNDLEISGNEVYRKKRQTDDTSPRLQETVYSHLYDGFMYAGDMEDEQIIRSMADDSTIRVNIYRENPPIMTANCARITKANQHSTNGIIHTLDRVMQPATKPIADIISSDPQFSILKKLMSDSGMLNQLREAGQMTLLAPTDAAFSTLSESELITIMEVSSCLPSVLKNHILPNVICSAAINSPEMKTLNLLEKFLKVELNENGKLFVEDAQVVAKDIMATNGVVHIIDKPILPTDSKPLMDVLEHKNLTTFLELLELAEMRDELSDLKDATVFAPTNEAFETFDNDEFEQIKNDKDRLRDVMRYHILKTPFSANDIVNNHQIDTAAGIPLRFNLYRGPHPMFDLRNLFNGAPRMQMTASCGVVNLKEASRACGAAVHVVNSFLMPFQHSVLGKLESDPDFSIFNQIIRDSSIADELAGEGPFTILAPSDHVFKTLPEAELESLLEDSELKDQLAQRHVLREHICCSGISPNTYPFHNEIRTSHGSTVHLHQTPGGLLKAGSARITQCSHSGSNGLVHTVNSLYVEPHIPERNDNTPTWARQEPFIIRIPFLGTH